MRVEGIGDCVIVREGGFAPASGGCCQVELLNFDRRRASFEEAVRDSVCWAVTTCVLSRKCPAHNSSVERLQYATDVVAVYSGCLPDPIEGLAENAGDCRVTQGASLWKGHGI